MMNPERSSSEKNKPFVGRLCGFRIHPSAIEIQLVFFLLNLCILICRKLRRRSAILTKQRRYQSSHRRSPNQARMNQKRKFQQLKFLPSMTSHKNSHKIHIHSSSNYTALSFSCSHIFIFENADYIIDSIYIFNSIFLLQKCKH